MIQDQKQNIKSNSSYYLTMTIVDWVDVFIRKNHCDAIIDSLKYCQENKGLVVFAYCIMSNHIHLIVNVDEPHQLKDTMRDFKKFTAKQILLQIQNEPESRKEWMLKIFSEKAGVSPKHKNFQFWQEGNHAIEVFSHDFVWTKINYIHNNPVKSGLVKEPHHWIYSSASNYQDMESVLFVEKIVHKLITY
ncbi:MAG: transposase [Bacteroidota bacterium]